MASQYPEWRGGELTEFLHMGGYWFFVWTSYAVALIVLVGLYLQPLRKLRKFENSVKVKK